MKISKNFMIYLICLLPFLEMPRFGYIQSINSIFLVFKIASALIVVLLVLKYRNINKLNSFIIVYCFIIIISTIINKGEIFNTISDAIGIIVPFFLIDIYLNKLSLRQLLLPIVVILTIYASITSIQILKVPFNIFVVHGLRDNYTSLFYDQYGPVFALGDTKRFSFMILPLVTFMLLLNKNFKKSFFCKICTVYICSISMFILTYCWAVSAMIMLTILIFTYIFLEINKNYFITKIINAKIFFYLYIILNILLTMTSFVDKFGTLLAVFGKSITLSGRTYIWQRGIEYIKLKPILGYGVNTELTMNRFWNLVHLHNYLINCLYIGGIILMVTILYILYMLQKKLSSNISLDSAKILSAAYIGFLILSLTDTVEYNILFMMFPLMYKPEKLKI